MHSDRLQKLRERWNFFIELATDGTPSRDAGRSAREIPPQLLADTRQALREVSFRIVDQFGMSGFDSLDEIAVLRICHHPLESVEPSQIASDIGELAEIHESAAATVDERSGPEAEETDGLELWKLDLLDELCLLQDGWSRAVEARELNLNDYDAVAWGRALGVEHVGWKSAWAAYDELVRSMTARLRAETLRFADVLETRLAGDPHKDWTDLMTRWRKSPLLREDVDCAPEAAEEGLKLIRERLTGWPYPGGVLDLSTPENRKQTIVAYIAEAWETTGKSITREMIWRRLGHRDPTGFQTWQRMGPKNTLEFDKKMERFLRDRPHLRPS